MACITISNLQPLGSELFSDSENYMRDLTEREVDSLYGGALPVIAIWSIKVASKYVVGAMAGGAVVGASIATLE